MSGGRKPLERERGRASRIGDEEEATIRTRTAYQEGLATFIQLHRGRVVDSTDDNLLVEFTSMVDAGQGAVAIPSLGDPGSEVK